MKTADELAREAFSISFNSLGRDRHEKLTVLFQKALDIPAQMKFVDGFVPKVKGWYWCQDNEKHKPEIVFVRRNASFVYRKRTYLASISFPGRFSHRLWVEGE